MSTIDDLEAVLATAWSDETLAVYGDELQARGDPRGDLIAIDRHLATAPATPELLAHRRERLEAWLGFDPRAWPETRFEHGFLDSSGAEVPRVLLYDVARYLRGVTIEAHDDDDMVRLVERLAGRPRPFLARLGLSFREPQDEPAIDPALAAALIAATPNLMRLELSSDRILPAFPHPRVRELSVDGPWATASLYEAGPALPAVERVEVAHQPWGDTPRDGVPSLLLPAAVFPELRCLDLRHSSAEAAVALLAATDALPRLEQLVLPTVPDDAVATALQEILARATALRELRTFGPRDPRLARLHPTARLAARPWPSRSSLLWHERLVVLIGGDQPIAYSAPLDPAIEHLEREFDRLAEPAQAAWAALWDAITVLPAPRPLHHADDEDAAEPLRALPRALLGRALEAGADRIDPQWARLAAAVGASALPVVAVRRGAG